jgi:Rho-binding antiterminator
MPGGIQYGQSLAALSTFTHPFIIMKTYQPISCAFYDELELRALRRLRCEIIYQRPGEAVVTLTTVIQDFQIRDKAEFMIVADGPDIRLDWLVSVDGIRLI